MVEKQTRALHAPMKWLHAEIVVSNSHVFTRSETLSGCTYYNIEPSSLCGRQSFQTALIWRIYEVNAWKTGGTATCVGQARRDRGRRYGPARLAAKVAGERK